MSTRFFAWAAAIVVACCGCRACSNCYDYSSPVAEPVGDGSGRAGSNLSDAQGPAASHVVPASFDSESASEPPSASERGDQRVSEYVFSLPEGSEASAWVPPWPAPEPDAEPYSPAPEPLAPADGEDLPPISLPSDAIEQAAQTKFARPLKGAKPAPFVR